MLQSRIQKHGRAILAPRLSNYSALCVVCNSDLLEMDSVVLHNQLVGQKLASTTDPEMGRVTVLTLSFVDYIMCASAWRLWWQVANIYEE